MKRARVEQCGREITRSPALPSHLRQTTLPTGTTCARRIAILKTRLHQWQHCTFRNSNFTLSCPSRTRIFHTPALHGAGGCSAPGRAHGCNARLDRAFRRRGRPPLLRPSHGADASPTPRPFKRWPRITTPRRGLCWRRAELRQDSIQGARVVLRTAHARCPLERRTLAQIRTRTQRGRHGCAGCCNCPTRGCIARRCYSRGEHDRRQRACCAAGAGGAGVQRTARRAGERGQETEPNGWRAGARAARFGDGAGATAADATAAGAAANAGAGWPTAILQRARWLLTPCTPQAQRVLSDRQHAWQAEAQAMQRVRALPPPPPSPPPVVHCRPAGGGAADQPAAARAHAGLQ